MDDKPVFKIFTFKYTKDAYALSPEQQAEFMKKHDEFLAQVGGKLLLTCDMIWSNEEFEYFGLESFPNMQALFTFHDCLRSIGWFPYFQSKTYLAWAVSEQGEPLEYVPPAPPEVSNQAIYKLVFSTFKTSYYSEQAKADELLKGQEPVAKAAGRVLVFGGYARMNNEENFTILIERFPSLEAMTAYYKHLEFSGWFKYSQARSYLGRAVGGEISGIEQ